MGQFACECTATGSGKDQFDYTDLYVAQFTLPDGSVVYVGGEYDSYGSITCAVEGGGSAKFNIVDGAGGEDVQRFVTGTYQFGYLGTTRPPRMATTSPRSSPTRAAVSRSRTRTWSRASASTSRRTRVTSSRS